MQKQLKYILLGAASVIVLILAGYYGLKLYNAAVEDATRKIKAGVEQGVQEGIGKGVGNAINPLKLPGKIFGGGGQ